MLSSSFNWTNSISFSRGKRSFKEGQMNNRKSSKYQRKNHALLCGLSCGLCRILVFLWDLWIHSVSVEKSLFFLPSSVDSSYIQYTILRRSFISHQLSRINESQLQILWTASMLCTLYWQYSRLHVRLSCWAKGWLNATYKLERLVLDRHWL